MQQLLIWFLVGAQTHTVYNWKTYLWVVCIFLQFLVNVETIIKLYTGLLMLTFLKCILILCHFSKIETIGYFG